MYTIDQINAMTPEQRKALETKLAKKLVIRVAGSVALAVGVQVALHFIGKKLEKDEEN